MSTVETMTGTGHGSTLEPLDEHGTAVRFETQCVVIPDPAYRSRRPRVVTKSYTLPLWKRRPSSAGHSNTSAPPEEASFEVNQSHLVLRVPLPTFSLKHHSTTRSVDHTPLPPCLVYRPSQPSGSSCASTPSQIRHARTPRKTSLSPSRSDIVTVPLRPCCVACQPVTEAALVDGDAWPEHFSHAASRRRSLSASRSPRTLTVAGSAASASYAALGISINVDEIDKRRRSSDMGPSTTSQQTLWSDDARSPPSPARVTPATPRIPEEDGDEDEKELFPLPSPKRTPTPSPSQSPGGSMSSLMATHGSQASSTCSGESAGLQASKRRDFLAPPPCASSSSLSLPKFSESTPNWTLPADPPRVPSPNLLSTLPSLSGRRLRSRSSLPRMTFVPPPPTEPLPTATYSTRPKIPRPPEPMTVPGSFAIPSHPVPSQSPSFPHHSPRPARFPWRSKRPATADAALSPRPSFSPSVSHTLSTSPNSNKVFSLSSPRNMFADMLRGVGAVAPSGMGPGF